MTLFVQSHKVPERANDEVNRAMVLLRDCVVGDLCAALHLIHHIRKPAARTKVEAADMKVARGASSMLGEAYYVFNLSDMSKQDAGEVGVDDDDRRS